MGYLDGFAVTVRQHRLFGGKRVTTEYSGGRRAKKRGDTSQDVDGDVKIPNRAEDKDLSFIQQLLPEAVMQANKVILQHRDQFEKPMPSLLMPPVPWTTWIRSLVMVPTRHR